MKNSIGNLAFNSHTKFWVSIFSFLQKWHHAYLRRAYTEAEISLQVGYFLVFQPHPAQERTNPHLTQNIMTLTLTFAPTNQNILAWATLHFAILHHCISNVLYCNQNTHCAQGPKSDYKHAYSHPLSNLLLFQSLIWSLSVFSLIIFLVFILAQLPLANWQHTIRTFTQMWHSSQSTLKKTQCTLHRLKLYFLFIFLWLL